MNAPAHGVRLLTALAVVCVCAPTALRGWEITRFSMAQTDAGDGGGTQALARWAEISGVAFAARESSLILVEDWEEKTSTSKQENDEAEALAVRPLSSQSWLLLSDLRLITGEPISKVADALAFSVLTGANEHELMLQRGLFGLSHWEILPLDLQNRVAIDLVAGPLADVPIEDRNKNRIRKLLSEKTEKARQDIRAVLQAQRVSAAGLAAVGL